MRGTLADPGLVDRERAELLNRAGLTNARDLTGGLVNQDFEKYFFVFEVN